MRGAIDEGQINNLPTEESLGQAGWMTSWEKEEHEKEKERKEVQANLHSGPEQTVNEQSSDADTMNMSLFHVDGYNVGLPGQVNC